MPEHDRTKRTGTQSIERAVRVLREITARSKFGWSASDLAVRCELDRSTTQRILACLVRERLVQQRLEDRHYMPGPLVFEMGLAMPSHAAFREASQPILTRIAKQVPGYALLCVRSGSDSVCVASAGTPAYLGTAFDVGTRRPLTSTAAGVAILIALPRDEAQRVVAKQLRLGNTRSDLDRNALERMWRRSVRQGFATNLGHTARGVNAVGIPLRDPDARPFGSLALAGPAGHLSAARMSETVATLTSEGTAIERIARRTFPKGAYNLPSS